jgi:transcriptional regulator with XRE-family HTH domain
MRTAALYAKFGVVLRRHREARELSQRDLAAVTGHQRTHIGLIERGVRNPTLSLANDFARALGTTLSVMIIEAEKIRGTVEATPVRHRRPRKSRRR